MGILKNINESRLASMYDEADPEKLIDMMSKAEVLSHKARDLEGQASDINRNIRETLERRLKVASKEEQEKYFDDQMKELAKQWQLMAASMVKVQRSVEAKGFHSHDNLYVNKAYGFKVYKCFSGWNLFDHIRPSDITNQANTDRYFRMEEDVLYYKRYGNEEILNFKALRKIPQFDNARIDALVQLTNDILKFMASWQIFYRQSDYTMTEKIRSLLNYGSYSSSGSENYRQLIRMIPQMIEFRDGIIAKLEVQSALTLPLVEKWKEANKNFVVLNELAKKELKI